MLSRDQVQAHVVCLLGKACAGAFCMPRVELNELAWTLQFAWPRPRHTSERMQTLEPFLDSLQVAGDGASEKAMHLDASDEPEVKHSGLGF